MTERKVYKQEEKIKIVMEGLSRTDPSHHRTGTP
jgi:hypothetical protein